MNKPKVFIGSSLEAKHYVDAINENLSYVATVTPWTAGVFNENRYTMEDLDEQLTQSSFAVFVLAPDDIVTLRGKVYLAPRDNTIFELGMFWGKLKRERVFFILPRSVPQEVAGQGIDGFRLPSDLLGLTLLYYELRDDNNYTAAVSVACAKITRQIEEKQHFADPYVKIQNLEREIRMKDMLLMFFINYVRPSNLSAGGEYDKLYEAVRTSYDISSLEQFRIRGAAIWRAEGNDGIRQVAGNVGKDRFYAFEDNDGRNGKDRILVLDAFLQGTVQFFLYRVHVAAEYIVCYPLGKELVITIHLIGPLELTAKHFEQISEDNKEFMNVLNYLFGGDLK
ncbi:TIR domain-containing protein [Paenibacillus sp. NPDC056722]|uniref:TIR domain-containing protein n=1 Tax=Paenibacillus sp. NPDC056722 TaxID=3345924 RepID=UPI0036D03720